MEEKLEVLKIRANGWIKMRREGEEMVIESLENLLCQLSEDASELCIVSETVLLSEGPLSRENNNNLTKGYGELGLGLGLDKLWSISGSILSIREMTIYGSLWLTVSADLFSLSELKIKQFDSGRLLIEPGFQEGLENVQLVMKGSLITSFSQMRVKNLVANVSGFSSLKDLCVSQSAQLRLKHPSLSLITILPECNCRFV